MDQYIQCDYCGERYPLEEKGRWLKDLELPSPIGGLGESKVVCLGNQKCEAGAIREYRGE